MNGLRHKVVVLGGGAAGMMAAGAAAEAGAKVILVEQNDRLGKKLAITGKGRCNVTNCCSAEEVLKNIPRNARFLYSALDAFSPEQAMAFFEAHGCPLKVERGNRVFPTSDKSASVIGALEQYLRSGGVEVFRGKAIKLLTQEGTVCGVETSRGTISASRVILATGGRSYPLTGPDGTSSSPPNNM